MPMMRYGYRLIHPTMLNPEGGQSYFNRGLVMQATGDHQGAISDYLEAAKFYEFKRQFHFARDARDRINKLKNAN
jgi:hypothetical protein